MAAWHGHADAVRELVASKADISLPDRAVKGAPGGGFPLMAAAAFDKLDAAVVLAAAGASLTQTTKVRLN